MMRTSCKDEEYYGHNYWRPVLAVMIVGFAVGLTFSYIHGRYGGDVATGNPLFANDVELSGVANDGELSGVANDGELSGVVANDLELNGSTSDHNVSSSPIPAEVNHEIGGVQLKKEQFGAIKKPLAIKQAESNLKTAFYVEHSPTTGRIFIERSHPDVFLSGRLVGPSIVGLRFFGISAEEFRNATAFPTIIDPYDDLPENVEYATFLVASYILPYPGKYKLSIKSALIKRSMLFQAKGNLYLWRERQEMVERSARNELSSVVPANLNNDTVKELGDGAPLVFYNSTPQLVPLIHWNDFRGWRNKSMSRSLQISHGFMDGRRVNRQCIVDALLKSRSTKVDLASPQRLSQQDDRKVCFYGDSHTRYAYNEIVFALEGTDYLQSADPKQPSKSHWFEYREVRFPEDLQHAVHDHAKIQTTCRKLFMNVGQWPLSWAVPYEKRPHYTLHAYEDELRKIFSSLSANINTTELIWMGTEPCPAEGMYLSESPSSPDYRHASFTELWSARGLALAKSFGIRALDNYWYLQPIMELTLDTCHYIRPAIDALVDVIMETALVDRAPDCFEYSSRTRKEKGKRLGAAEKQP